MATTMGAAAPAAPAPVRPPSVVDLVRTHWVFSVLLFAGAVLRVVTALAYRPALLYIDSLSYLTNIGPLRPSGARPIGYSIFLRPLTAFGELHVIPVVQHAMGLALAVGIYALLVRAGTRRWLAALACAPLLLDAYQLQIEQNVLSETLFQVMIFGGLVLLVDGAGRERQTPRSEVVGHRLWQRRLVTAAVAGLLLGLAVPVRLIGQFVLLTGGAYLLFERGRRWSDRVVTAGVFAAVFIVPVLAYMAYFQSWTGDFTLTPVGGQVLYGRAATLVDCDRIVVPADQRDLCPDEPLGQRLKIDNYVWNQESPVFHHVPPPGLTLDQSLREFGMLVIRQQPMDVARAVTIDMAKMFWPTKAQFPNDVDVGRWQFQEVYPRYGYYREVLAAYGSRPQIASGLAGFLRRYQLSVGYTPGPVLLVALVFGLAAGVGLGGTRRSPLGGPCLLFAATGAALCLLPALYEFSWRYMLPALVTMPVAGALGFTALIDRNRTMTATTDQPAMVDADEVIDRGAVARFTREYQAPRLGPIAVVIAAYDEQDAIGDVLTAIPSTIEATPVSVVVVDDGSSDATGEVVRRHNALLVEPGVNRGQGAALRLGYRVAREHGATIIATLDADGQYDPAELRTVVAPILRNEADFVTGSRRLGREETTDNFRRAGVRFYALMVSALTRQRITDTSFGLRAMRAEVTATVTLRQPQYQSSELLIGALAHGFRVVEVPTTMRQRTAGESKKGNNLLYGLRYGGVVVGTWLSARASQRAARRRARRDRRSAAA